MFRRTKYLLSLVLIFLLVMTVKEGYLGRLKNLISNFNIKETANKIEKITSDTLASVFDQLEVNISPTTTTDNKFEEVIIERVVDGDTIIVIDDNGNSFRVRLIGVDTPESVNPDESKNSEAGRLASEYTKSRLLPGDVVYLEYDKQKTDVYNRTLAYVWLTNDESCVIIQDDGTPSMYNAELIIQGYAVPKVYEPNSKYSSYFQDLYDDR